MLWTEQFERAILKSVFSGTVGDAGPYLRPDLFTEGRETLFRILHAHYVEHGVWPEQRILHDLVRKDVNARAEWRSIALVRDDTEKVATKELIALLRKRSLQIAIHRLSEIAETDYEDGDVRSVLDTALSAGKAHTAFEYAADVALRHDKKSLHIYRTPLGLPALDTITEGGLRAGALGLIMGPTKRGKSHVAVAFGAAALRAGKRVLHISLELSAEETACRYDRNLLMMDKHEAYEQRASLQKRLDAIFETSNLQMVHSHRFGLGTSDIRRLALRAWDTWKTPFTLIVDYGALLRPGREDLRHAQVGRIHEELSSIAQEMEIPIWCPYQTNRAALTQEKQKVAIGLECAGDSYESVQHADLILALQQGEDDWVHNQMRIAISGARDCGSGTVLVRPDWARSTVTEVTA